MTFLPLTDPVLIDYHQFEPGTGEISSDGKIVLGKWRVMFGYRLRVGGMKNAWYDLDLCCGALDKDYKFLLEKVKAKIISNPVDDRFKGIPTATKIKPYINDDEFLDLIEKW